MTYMILDSTGNAVNSYEDEVAAHAALRALVADDPSAADHLLVLRYDEDGHPVGDALTYADLPRQTSEVMYHALVLVSNTLGGRGEGARWYEVPRPSLARTA